MVEIMVSDLDVILVIENIFCQLMDFTLIVLTLNLECLKVSYQVIYWFFEMTCILQTNIVKKKSFTDDISLTYSGWMFLALLKNGEKGNNTPPSPLFPKICHTYPAKMKLTQLYLTQKRPKKYMNHLTHSWSSANISVFLSEISKLCSIRKYKYRLLVGT